MPASPNGATLFRFGRYEVDGYTGELRREGRIVHLAAKPAALLLHLLRNRTRLVGKQELVEALWPDVRVSDAALASALRDLRRALEDDGAAPRFIETLRGRGYRFLAPVIEYHPARASPFDSAYVGRDALLAQLAVSITAALAGSGRVVLLGGEAGIGKTRTAAELAERARERGAAVATGSCSASPRRPFCPWAEVLEAGLACCDPADVDALLDPYREELARLVPALERAQHADPPEDGEEALPRLFEGVCGFLCDAASRAPLAIVLDDLHLANRESLELLERLVSRIATVPLLLVATYRSPELAVDHPLRATLAALDPMRHVVRVVLGGLGPEEARAFVDLHKQRAISGEVADVLCKRSGGNPFFLLQLVRWLNFDGEGVSDADAARAVPVSVREWVRTRLRACSPGCAATLETAALLGTRIDLTLLGCVTGLPPEVVAEQLDEGQRAGLVTMGSAHEWHFVHALVSEAIYADLAVPRRIALHERAGHALRALASADRPELLAAVARHLTEAAERVGPEAVEAAADAADNAERQLAYEEAARLRSRALEALDRVDPTNRVRRAALLLGLARAQLGDRMVRLACDTARKAAAVAREVGAPTLLAGAALVLSDYVPADSAEPIALLEEVLPALEGSPPLLRSRALGALSMHLWYVGDVPRRLALAQEAIRLAQIAGNADGLALALLAYRHALVAPERLLERLRVESDALRENRRSGNQTLRCLVLSWRAVDLLESGAIAEAERDVAAIEAITQTGRARRAVAFPWRWRSMRSILAGRYAEAQAHIAASAEQMRATDDPHADAYSGIQLASALHEQGRRPELERYLATAGAPWLDDYRQRVPAVRAALASLELEAGRPQAARLLLAETAADGWAALERDPEQLGTLSWLAESCAELGDAEHAAQLFERTAGLRDRNACFYAIACRGSAALYIGLLARTAGLLDEAAECFEQAVEANRSLDATPYAAWALWRWSETLRRRGRAGDATRADALAAEAADATRCLGLGRLADAMRAGGGPR
jgi:DNA-binding winged helix-turn-helix (wHTH) protein